jgi:hypothetical protein
VGQVREAIGFATPYCAGDAEVLEMLKVLKALNLAPLIFFIWKGLSDLWIRLNFKH